MTCLKKNIGVYHSSVAKASKKGAYGKPVLITTYNSLCSLVKSGEIDPHDFPVVILDEVHRAKGEQTKIIVDRFRETSLVQGWTATDMFVYNRKISHIGQILFGGDSALHRTDFGKAVSNREVVPVKNIIFETSADPGINDNTTKQEYSESDLKKLNAIEGRDEAIVKAITSYRDEETGQNFSDMLSVWYCNGINHAQKMTDILNAAFGYQYAVMVSGKMPAKKVDSILSKQKAGDIRAIINADILIEGWDSPATQLCVMARTTRSPAIAEQTGGRVARLDPNNPSKIGFVATIIDQGMHNLCVFGNVAQGHYNQPIVQELIAKSEKNNKQIYIPNKKTLSEENYNLIKIKAYCAPVKIIEFLDNRQKIRKKSAAPLKEPGWRQKFEYADLLSVSSNSKTFKQFWNSVQAQYDEFGKVMIDDRALRCAYMLAGSNTTFYVHEDELDSVKKEFSKTHKTGDWLSKTEFLQELGIRHNNTNATIAWEKIETLYNAHDASPVYLDKAVIECGYKQSHAIKPFCIHRASFQALKEEMGIADKKEDEHYFTKATFATQVLRISYDNERFQKLWDDIEREYNSRPDNKATIGDHELNCRYQRNKGHHFYIHDAEAEFFITALRLGAPGKHTASLKNKTQFSKLLNKSITQKEFDVVWREIESSYDKGFVVVDDCPVKAGYEKRGPKQVFLIDESETEWFRQRMMNAKLSSVNPV